MADSRWMQRIEQSLGDLAVRSHKRPRTSLIIALLFTAVGGFFASRLPMVADLEHLIPKSFESVQDLEPLKKRFGGIGYVVVVGMGAEPDQLRRFADEMAPKIAKLPSIRYVDYQRSGDFFDERKLYYLSVEDLAEVRNRIKAREKYERRQANPMFVKLDDEEPPSLDMSDIQAKYSGGSEQRLASGGAYYLDETKKMVFLLAKPEKIAADLAYSEQLVKQTEDFLAAQDLSSFGPDFKWGLTGTFKYKVDQQRQLSTDMRNASAVAMALLLIYLAFHFRSVLAVGLIMGPVLAGLTWTYGITAGIFGSLNILTGFLGAILGGLGIEHGIHLLGRYQTLRAQGVSSEAAVRESFLHTGGSALVSSWVASLTFLSIAYSEFRAFREFGVIASIGMVVVIVSYFLILPAVLGLASRAGWKPAAITPGLGKAAHLIPRFYRQITIGSALVLATLIAFMSGVRFDFDFHSLEDSSLPSFTLDRETNEILGYNMEPVVILTKTHEDERELVKALKARKEQQGKDTTIHFVAAISDLVPEQQEEKKAILDDIAGTLAKVNLEKLDAKNRPEAEKLSKWVKAAPFTKQDVPQAVRRQFEGVGGPDAQGGFVLIFPNIKLSDGQAVLRFAKEVRGITLANGNRYSAAGEAMILADVLTMINNDVLPILLLAIFSVLAAMWLTLGSLRTALICMSPTVLSLLALIGVMAILKLPFNYLNIIVVPVLIGTTVDAGVHLLSRLSDAGGQFTEVYAETGRAIVGGLITSGVGFGALLLADHPGLNSTGRLANLGFVLNMVVMIVSFPALLFWLNRGKAETSPSK
jgi:predicted RND superfamily exporter protein